MLSFIFSVYLVKSKNMYKEKEAYCDTEISRLLKEAGFDWECNSYYGCDGRIIPYNGCSNSRLLDELCTRPTQQVAVKYLREEKDIFIYAECIYAYKDYDVHKKEPKWWWQYRIRLADYPLMSNGDENKMFSKQEDAINEALVYSLNVLLTKRKNAHPHNDSKHGPQQ